MAERKALKARLYVVPKSGNYHIRVYQPWHTDEVKARMRRVATPANFINSSWEWDYPLSPAAILSLSEVAKEMGLELEWDHTLQAYAEQELQANEYEESVRLAIEKYISDASLQLDPYITNDFQGAKPPMRHQRIVYHWSLRARGLLLCHDPGLGKSRSSIDAAAGWYRQGLVRPMEQVWLPEQQRWGVRGGVLVVCPKVVVHNWSVEMHQWQGMVGLEIVSYSREKKLERLGMMAHAHIINYASLKLVLGNQYDGLIVDESHCCANNSQQTQNTLQLSLHAKRKLLLTGTPVSNSLRSVFFQMLICDGGRALGASRQKFLEEYFTVDRNGPRTEYVPNQDAVEKISALMSRNTYFLAKSDALDLPEQTHTPLYLEMTEEQRRYYNNLKNETITYIQDTAVTVEMAQTKLMKLAQVCQGFVLDDQKKGRHFNDAKTNALIDLLVNTYPQRKVIVWTRFTYEIERVCKLLQDAGLVYARFDGTVKGKAREQALYNWEHDPNLRVFVGQISMGIGVNLTAKDCAIPCCDTIYLGLDYKYVSWYQSVQRMHRIGQRWPCNYIYLLTDNGVDKNIYNSVLSKQQLASEVYSEGKDYYLSLLTDETSPVFPEGEPNATGTTLAHV